MSKYRGYVSAMALAIGLLLATSTQAAVMVDAVRCIPWQGDTAKYHTTIADQPVNLMAVITATGAANVYYQWSYGDGSADSAVTQLSAASNPINGSANLYPIAQAHTYTGSVGTPFIAELRVADNPQMTNPVTDTYLIIIADNILDARVNMAIDKGLWRLYTWMTYTNGTSGPYRTLNIPLPQPAGVWDTDDGYYAAETASVIQAFMINNHKSTGNHAQDPYAQAVAWGFNWLFNGSFDDLTTPVLRSFDVSDAQDGEWAEDYNNDGNLDAGDTALGANNRGTEVGDDSGDEAYQGGIIIDAILASGTPDADAGRDINGDGRLDTYKEVVQDMIDAYAWGQMDPSAAGDHAGSWRYYWNYPWDNMDNSCAQWAAIGIMPAEDNWGCLVPDWVKTRNRDSLLNESYTTFGPDGMYGRFGYGSENPCCGGEVYWPGDFPNHGAHATTPSGMILMLMDGLTTADDRWQKCERWLADGWNVWLNHTDDIWINNVPVDYPYIYGHLAFTKAMRLAKPAPIDSFSSNGFDWYRGDATTSGLAQKLIDLQNANGDGHWDGVWTWSALPTSWGVIMLKPALFSAAPIACFSITPNFTYINSPVDFDPACSDHSETGKDIDDLVLFEWDFDNDGQYDDSSVVPEVVTHSFPCAQLPCTYPVTLRVTDGEGLTARATQNVVISDPPHPPVAVAGGPYLVSRCPGDTVTLDGSNSSDPNTGDPNIVAPRPDDRITAWGWDLTPPMDDFDDRTGADQPVPVILDQTEIGQFFTLGLNNVGLQVTDNTVLSYPGNLENLTDTDFTTVEVFEGCICELTATPLCATAETNLTWDDIGARRYDVYRSVTGINSGFRMVDTTTENMITVGRLEGVTNYYRVMAVNPNGGLAVAQGLNPEQEDEVCLSRAVAVVADPGECTGDPGVGPGRLRVPPGSQEADYIMVTLTNVCGDNPDASEVLGLKGVEGGPTQFMMGTYDPNFPPPNGTGGYIQYGNGLVFQVGRANWVLSRKALDLAIECPAVGLAQDVDVPLWYNPLLPNGAIQAADNGNGNETIGPMSLWWSATPKGWKSMPNALEIRTPKSTP